MARHRSFGSEFKRQIAKEYLDGRAGLHELARRHSLSRNLIRLWIRKYEAFDQVFPPELKTLPGCCMAPKRPLAAQNGHEIQLLFVDNPLKRHTLGARNTLKKNQN